MARPSRAVITLATTKMLYVDMAFNLARSFEFWNRGSGVAFHIISDLDISLPEDLQEVELVRLRLGQLGPGFVPKLHLDSLAPADQTLFIDSDCLCLGPVHDVFERFTGRPVAVVGGSISSGAWWGSIPLIRSRTGVKSLPHFNGGLYYVERCEATRLIYARAREIAEQYDEWGLLRLRGHPNDEIVMAIAMAEAGLEALPDDGSIMVPFNFCPQILDLNVFAGKCRVANPPPTHPLHSPVVPVRVAEPRFPHFVNTYTDHWRYRAEAAKLRLHLSRRQPRWLAQFLAWSMIAVPGWLQVFARTTLRPLYRALFGVRAVTRSKRV